MYHRDYVDFDENGPKEVRCMKCGTQIAKRLFGKMRQNASFRQVRIAFKIRKPGDAEYHGSYFDAMVCGDCAKGELDNQELLQCVRAGWEKEQTYLEWTEEQKAKYQEQYNDIVMEAA